MSKDKAEEKANLYAVETIDSKSSIFKCLSTQYQDDIFDAVESAHLAGYNQAVADLSTEKLEKKISELEAELDLVECDVYVNINDPDDAGSLEDLMLANGYDFDIEDYKLCTPKGTPFLWDGN